MLEVGGSRHHPLSSNNIRQQKRPGGGGGGSLSVHCAGCICTLLQVVIAGLLRCSRSVGCALLSKFVHLSLRKRRVKCEKNLAQSEQKPMHSNPHTFASFPWWCPIGFAPLLPKNITHTHTTTTTLLPNALCTWSCALVAAAVESSALCCCSCCRSRATSSSSASTLVCVCARKSETERERERVCVCVCMCMHVCVSQCTCRTYWPKCTACVSWSVASKRTCACTPHAPRSTVGETHGAANLIFCSLLLQFCFEVSVFSLEVVILCFECFDLQLYTKRHSVSNPCGWRKNLHCGVTWRKGVCVCGELGVRVVSERNREEWNGVECSVAKSKPEPS